MKSTPTTAYPPQNCGETSGLDVRLEDFTRAEAPTETDQFNLLICNPPYVRHHHIENGEKQRLKARTQAACGVEIKGLAGLYCYFPGAVPCVDGETAVLPAG